MDDRGLSAVARGGGSWAVVLDDFFERQSAGKTAATRRRYAQVRDEWFEMFDELEVHEAAAPTTLVEFLPAFLSDDWLLDAVTVARTQVSLCERLLVSLRRTGTVDPRAVFSTWLKAESAVFHARARLRGRRPARAQGRPQLRLIRGGLDRGADQRA